MLFGVYPVLGSQRQKSNQQSGTIPSKVKEVWIHPIPCSFFTHWPLQMWPFPCLLTSLSATLLTWLAGGEGETASGLSCVSDGDPQSDPLHPDRWVHTLLGLCELHLQGSHFLSPSHTYAPGHWVIWAQITFVSTVQIMVLERSSCIITAERWICERCRERRRDLHGGEWGDRN